MPKKIKKQTSFETKMRQIIVAELKEVLEANEATLAAKDKAAVVEQVLSMVGDPVQLLVENAILHDEIVQDVLDEEGDEEEEDEGDEEDEDEVADAA